MQHASTIKEQLLDLIKDTAAKGGSRLPSERDLAAATGTSRVTLGKVIAELVGEGVLVRRHGSGTYIVGRDKSTRPLLIGVGAKIAELQNDQHFSKIISGLPSMTESPPVQLQIFDRLADYFSGSAADNRVLGAIDAKLLDGFLVVGRMPLGVVEQLRSRVPLVVVNGALNDGEQVCVSCDYVEVGHLAARYLLARGHTRIAYVCDDLNNPERWQNECGIRLAMEGAGREFPEERRVLVGRNYDYLKQHMREFVETQPDVTAVIVRNDIHAWRIIHVLEEMGKRVPDDISVIGVGNYETMGKSSFKLTTVDNRLEEMARRACELLVGMIRGTQPKMKIHLLRPKLIERDTVCHRQN